MKTRLKALNYLALAAGAALTAAGTLVTSTATAAPGDDYPYGGRPWQVGAPVTAAAPILQANRYGIERPVLVFVEFDSLYDLKATEGRGRISHRSARRAERLDRSHIDNREALALNTIAINLPEGIQLVSRPRAADLIIRAVPRGYDVNFRVTDVDRKLKRRKTASGKVAFTFNRVRERARLDYAYDFTVRIPGGGRFERRVDGQVADGFIYADTIAGVGRGARGARFTTARIEELAARNTPEYRRGIVQNLRLEAEREVARKISHVIRLQAAAFFDPAYIDGTGYTGRGGIVDQRFGRQRDQQITRHRRGGDRLTAGEAVGIGIAAGVLAVLIGEAID